MEAIIVALIMFGWAATIGVILYGVIIAIVKYFKLEKLWWG